MQARKNYRPHREVVLTWVPVTAADGHVRMEMRWHVGEATKRIKRKHPAS